MTPAVGPAPAAPSAQARPVAPGPSLLAVLVHHARARSAGVAIRAFAADGSPGATHTWGDLAAAVFGAAEHLRAAFASPPRDAAPTLILRCEPSPEFIAWFFASLAAGVRVLAIHPLAAPHELAAAAERCGAGVLVAREPSPALADLAHIPLSRLASLAAPRSSWPSLVDLAPGDLLLQSSGTTAHPKIVRRTALSLDADARNIVEATALTAADRVLSAVPLSHSYGVDMLVASILAGATTHVFEGFDLAAAQRHLAEGHATVFPGVPFMFAALARDERAAPPAKLRMAFSAGTSMPPRVWGDLARLWGHAPGQLYGATELGSVTLGTHHHTDFDPAGVGRPMSGVSVRVLAADDPARLAPAGEEGELAIAAPSMLAEYLGDPLPLADGHFLTGDLGRVDALGRVYVTGRLKHLLDVGGHKINPLEVERVFTEHPAIADCAVVPVALSDTIARLRLLYVPRPGATTTDAELRAFARDRLAPYKLPRSFAAIASLPRSPSGKLLRHLIGESSREP